MPYLSYMTHGFGKALSGPGIRVRRVGRHNATWAKHPTETPARGAGWFVLHDSPVRTAARSSTGGRKGKDDPATMARHRPDRWPLESTDAITQGDDDMMKREAASRPTSRREREHAAMLREALARPGIREVMKVYDGWQEKDRGLDAYRAATKTPAQTTTTNHTRVR